MELEIIQPRDRIAIRPKSVLGDPTYGNNSKGTAVLDTLPGLWQTAFLRGPYDAWGDRVWSFVTHHPSLTLSQAVDATHESERMLPVDAGLMAFRSTLNDYKYLSDAELAQAFEDEGYAFIRDGSGFVCETGIGDGWYSWMYSINSDNSITAVRQDFFAVPECEREWTFALFRGGLK